MENLQHMSDIMRYLIGLNIDVAVIPPIWRLPMFGMSVSFFFGRDVVLLQMRNNLARIPSRIIKRVCRHCRIGDRADRDGAGLPGHLPF